MLTAESLIATGRDCAPPLTPKLAPWMDRILQQPVVLADWLQNYGSPVHIVVGSEFRRNVKDLLSPLQLRGLSGGLFFARKANKLPWFVTMAKEEGIGVDTASLSELRETLQLGVPPQQIVVTAVGKSRELIEEAVKHGCRIVIDNDDELDLAKAVVHEVDRQAQIGLRFSGFIVQDRQVFSRFGLPVADAHNLVDSIREESLLNLDFLHAHLDRYDLDERASAARQMLAIADYANSRGHKITSIDLGGGILMRYLDNASEWESFKDALLSSVREERPYFTYLNDGLGYMRAGSEIIGRADLYPAWNSISKERFISAILDHQLDGMPLHKQFSDRKLKLYFEPGRALLDNTGMTATRVTFRKRDTLGNLLIGVAMNRLNLRPFRAEFCSDPFFLSTDSRMPITEGAFLVGNLCSESDLIYRRKLRLGTLPMPGDTVCFANSAGYLAHHMEIGTHGDPLPQNLLICAENWQVCDSLA
jgi:diaminopimelate decarboxylase